MRLPSYDKTLHAVAGAGAALVTLLFGLWISVGLVVAIATGKELYDALHPDHTAELGDIIATVIGAALVWGGYLLGVLR